MATVSKTFSVRHGIDVANTIIIDSSRNLSNIASANATTVNATNFVTVAGLNLPNHTNNAYAAANSAANTVCVSQNSASTLSSKQLNFVNTSSIIAVVSDSGDGNANIAFVTSGASAADAYNQANAAYVQANAAYEAANNVGQETSYNTTTTSIETVDTWSANTYRSGKYQIQATSSLGYLACEIMIIHNGSIVNLAQYANVSFGESSIGTFSSDLNNGNTRLRFTAVDSTTRIRYFRSLLKNDVGQDPEVLPTDLMTGTNSYDLMNSLFIAPTDLNA